MASCCCTCPGAGGGQTAKPLICMVPRGDGAKGKSGSGGGGPDHISTGPGTDSGFQFLDDDFLRKHFKFPPRALYLDPFRRPLISFPMSGENTKNFNMARKNKINQMILDGFLDPSEAISAPSVFPYANTNGGKDKKSKEEEEVIYILQLPDWEFKCPVHNQTIRTPRFIWHSCKKSKKEGSSEAMKQGRGPLNKPKPWILARHTDFDLMSQW